VYRLHLHGGNKRRPDAAKHITGGNSMRAYNRAEAKGEKAAEANKAQWQPQRETPLTDEELKEGYMRMVEHNARHFIIRPENN